MKSLGSLRFEAALAVLVGLITHAMADDPLGAGGSSSNAFPEPMYLLEIGPEPGKAGMISYALSANPDVFQVEKGMVKKKLGGPFQSSQEARAASSHFQITSLGPTQARVYDSKGKWLTDFTVLLDPSDGRPPPGGGPADRPLVGNVGFNSKGGPQPRTPNANLPYSVGTRETPDKVVITEISGEVHVWRGEQVITLGAGDVQSFQLRFGDLIELGRDGRLKVLYEPTSGTAELWDQHYLVLHEMTDVKLEPGMGTLWNIRNGYVDIEDVHHSMRYPDGQEQTTVRDEPIGMHPWPGLGIRSSVVTGSEPIGTKWSTSYDRNRQAHRFDVTEGKVLVTPKNTSLKPRMLTAGKWCIVYPDHIEPPDPASEVDDSALRGLAMETRTVHIGTQLTMPVLLKGIPSGAAGGLGNLNFEVTYDPSVVAVKGNVSRGNVASGMSFEANPKENGRIQIGFAGAHGVTQTGTVAQIPFEVRGQPGQQTALTIKILQCQTPKNQPVTLAITHGKIIVASSNVAAGGALGPGGEHLAPSSGHVSPNGQVTPTENLAPSSHHIPPALRNPDGTLKGDMDGKGRLTAKDAEGALQMSVGLRPVNMNLDVDKDGRVMSADARLILQGATGMMGP